MRILIVDDEPALHIAYRNAFAPSAQKSASSALGAMASELFADLPSAVTPQANNLIELTAASQGTEALALVEKAIKDGCPYQVAFIDIRMPPGIDGKETAKRMRSLDPDINLVIVTAYSDHSVTDIATVAGPADKIFYIAKPFAADEVLQMAVALAHRWEADHRQVERLREKIAELAASEARAIHAAHHDFLTGAPNRMGFQRDLIQLLRNPSSEFALVMLDLDRFKHVNDTFGHGAGDELLQSVYKALKQVVPADAKVARLGGDEFGILAPLDSGIDVVDLSHKAIEACSQTFNVFGHSVEIGASAGIMISRGSCAGDGLEQMRCADLALFAAKRDGRGVVRVFDAEMDSSTRFRQLIELALKNAIARNELSLVYQPIVERHSLTVVGFEALLRWCSAEHGDVPPAVFIPVAEESGLIHEIGDWVVTHALEDSKSWPDLYVSINFSPKQFKRVNLAAQLGQRADEIGVPFSRIQVEITETAIFDDTERAAKTLSELQTMGFRLALDDFGTGYSNLLNIKNFALDCLKIDKSFVDAMGLESDSTAIIHAITYLARHLGMNVVAEGVETDMQCQALRVVGCSHLQGYLFGKPVGIRQTIDQIDIAQADAHAQMQADDLASRSAVRKQHG